MKRPRNWDNKYRVAKNGCWVWLGSRDMHGYGKIHTKHRRRHRHVGAHRLSYIMTYGPIRRGLVVDHLCRNRLCVNPSHMDIVTHGENLRRDNGPNQETGCEKFVEGCKTDE